MAINALRDALEDVVRETGYPAGAVRAVIESFLKNVIRRVYSGQELHVRGLGKLLWIRRDAHERRFPRAVIKTRIGPRLHLRFRPAEGLRRGLAIIEEAGEEKAVSEDGMTKYGVETEPDKTKTGSEGQSQKMCPWCGADLDGGGACPVHGTEPFEKKPGGAG